MKENPSAHQLPLPLTWGVSREMACAMCHFSSECGGCCNKCREEGRQCGTSQICSLPYRHMDGQRLATWIHLIQHSASMKRLKKFIPKGYRLPKD